MDKRVEPKDAELFAEELPLEPSELGAESLDNVVSLGTWGSGSSFMCGSCPSATASTAATASCFH